jgi:hypothetical protein
MLIIVGLASFYFKSASMFIVYGVTLGWAGISNLLSLNGAWVLGALFQFFLSFSVFTSYRRYHNVEKDYLTKITSLTGDQKPTPPAGRAFPWVGSFFGCASILGFLFLILLIFVIIIGSNNTTPVPEYFTFIEGLIVNIGVLGFAIGLACVVSKYRYKGLGILGMITGFLTMATELAFILINQFG